MQDPNLNPLRSDALDSNRRGQLTATQRDGFARPLQQRNRNALSIAGALLVVAALAGGFAPPSLAPVWRIAIVVVALGISVSLILRALTGGDKALGRDLHHGRVLAVTGPITKEQELATDPDATSIYILKIGDQHFTVPAMTFEAAPRSGRVRLYYLPASREVVNLEALTDGMLTGVPPPLAEAIIGSWRNNFANATFTSDGRVTASVMGRHSVGQWSVDAEGRLHAEFAGRSEIAQASISGEQLNITLTGRMITLSRET
jgi:hypothetical protein